jgi:hypothetical protein
VRIHYEQLDYPVVTNAHLVIINDPGSLKLPGSYILQENLPKHIRFLAEKGNHPNTLSTRPPPWWMLNSGSEIQNYIDSAIALGMEYILSQGKKDEKGFAKSQENELIAKLTWQQGALPLWGIMNWSDTLIAMDDDAAYDLSSSARELLGDFKFSEAKPIATKGYVRHSNHSYPDFQTSDISLKMHALMASLPIQKIRDLEVWLAQLFGLSRCTWTYSRSGPIARPQKVPSTYEITYNESTKRHTLSIDWKQETLGLAPRRRVVLGVSSYRNLKLYGMMLELKRYLTYQPWSAIGKGPDYALTYIRPSPYTTIFSDDVSGWDQSIGFNLQDRIGSELTQRGLHPELTHFWRETEDLEVAIGIPGGAFIRQNKGGITSGIITTSVMGTLLNSARVMSVIRRLHIPLHKVRWLVLGDDTLIEVQNEYAKVLEDNWADINKDLGFKTGLLREYTFLMRNVVETDAGKCISRPLFSRLLQQFCMPERLRRPSDATFVASVYAKYELLKELYNKTGNKIVRTAIEELWRRTRLPEAEEVGKMLRNRDHYLFKSLYKQENDPMMREWVAAREHSPVAQLVMSILNLPEDWGLMHIATFLKEKSRDEIDNTIVALKKYFESLVKEIPNEDREPGHLSQN